MRNTRLSALRRRVTLFVSEVCTKVMPTEQPAKETPVSSLAKRDPNDLFYINLPMDRALLAFTHAAGYFVHMGFSIVPHTWLPEKIEADCRSCALFRNCGQYAVMLPLVRVRQTCVPLTALHA